jgi:hypothetical protein
MNGAVGIRIVGTLIIIGLIVFVWNFLAASINTVAVGYGPIAATVLIVAVGIGVGAVWASIRHSHNAGQMALESLRAMNQTSTKDDFAATAQITVAGIQGNTATANQLWTQQRAWAAQQQEFLQEQARANQAWLQQQARDNRMLLIQATRMMMLASGKPVDDLDVGATMQQMNQEPAEDDIPQMTNHYNGPTLDAPSLQEDMRVLQKVPDPNRKNHWEMKDSTQIIQKYKPNIQILADRIRRECHPYTEFTYEAISAKLGYNSKQRIQEALDMLAELGYCTPKNLQGIARVWLDPNTGRPFEDPELLALNSTPRT